MANINADVNQFPSLTWNHLNINRTHLNASIEEGAALSVLHLPEGIELSRKTLADSYGNDQHIETGLGKEFDRQYDRAVFEAGILVHEFYVKSSSSIPVRISYSAEGGKSCTGDNIIIHASSGTESTFILDFSSALEADGDYGLRIRIFADSSATVHLITVNMLSGLHKDFLSLGSAIEDNACIDVVQLELGGGTVCSGSYHNLKGYKSAVKSNVCYVVNENHSLDMNYVARQTGRETESFMRTDGVVMDSASKVWRGTIDFVKGCKESKGDEQEDVLLLNPDVVNKTLPVILCDEEAVEGRHGSSIGRLGKDILFYMQSRGVDEETARKLMIKAKISSTCKRIPDQDLVSQIKNFVEGAFTK